MNAQEPDAVAMGPLPGTGFHVNWEGVNVELQIPAPARIWPILINGILSLLFFGGGLGAGWIAIQLWSIGDDTADFCSWVTTPLFEVLFLWLLLGSIRRTARPFRRGPLTRLGATHGTLWCQPADAPATRYYWPAEEIWRMSITPARFGRFIMLEVRSRRRPVVRLRIPCRSPVDTRPLIHILQYAMGSAAVDLPKTDVIDAGTSDAVQYAKPATSQGVSPEMRDSTLPYSGDNSTIKWVTVGSYQEFSQWHDARTALAVLGVVARLVSSPPGSQAAFELLAPESQAEQARRWLARPEVWHDRSRCPSCGEDGTPMGFFRRIKWSVREPTRPVALGKAWRFCNNCRQAYFGRD